MDARPGGEAVDRLRGLVSAFRSLERRVAERLRLNATDSAAVELLERTGPQTPGRLAVGLGVTPAAATFVIDRLTAAGHVVREPNPRDGRSTLIRVAPGASARAAAVMEPVAAGIQQLWGAMDEQDRAAVLSFLTSAARVFEEAGEGGRDPSAGPVAGPRDAEG